MCGIFTFLFAACSKSEIQTDALPVAAAAADAEAFDLMNADFSAGAEKVKEPRDCCQCNFWVYSDGASTYTGPLPQGYKDNWTAQVMYEDCETGSSPFLTVGYTTVTANQYPASNVGQWIAYPFTVQDAPSDLEIRIAIGSDYPIENQDDGVIEVRTKVICEKDVYEPFVIPRLNLACDELGAGAPQGCGSIGPDGNQPHVDRFAQIDDCTALATSGLSD